MSLEVNGDKWARVGIWETSSHRSVVPSLFGTRDQFCGRQFFLGQGWGLEGQCSLM